MSDKELTRLEIMQKLDEKSVDQNEASRLLEVSTRQVKRLFKAYRVYGVDGLISKHRGKTSNRKNSLEFKENVLEHVRASYADFGPTLANEKLLERHQLKINKETLRQWMMEANIWKGKCRKNGTVHQQRSRRPCFGELVQIDGSPHAWFEGRREKCCLLVFIDDATSKIVQLRFEEAETTFGYFRAVKDYIKNYGRPLAFYNDKHGIFRVNMTEAETGTGETQFGRAMRELGIEVICANSPQAKGRVERANGTLQDRLVKELRLRRINDIETANTFLPEFIENFNKKFAVEAGNPIDVHRKELPDEATLDLIFTLQYQRTLSKNLELSYNNIIYQIKTESKSYAMRYAKVTVCADDRGQIRLIYKNKNLAFEIFDKKNKAVSVISSKEINDKIDGRSKGHKPKADHPWKRYEATFLKGHLPTGSTSLAGVI